MTATIYRLPVRKRPTPIKTGVLVEHPNVRKALEMLIWLSPDLARNFIETVCQWEAKGGRWHDHTPARLRRAIERTHPPAKPPAV